MQVARNAWAALPVLLSRFIINIAKRSFYDIALQHQINDKALSMMSWILNQHGITSTGVSPLTLGERALEKLEKRTTKVANWYLDMNMIRKYVQSAGGTLESK